MDERSAELLINIAADCSVARTSSEYTFEAVQEIQKQLWNVDDRLDNLEDAFSRTKTRNKTAVGILSGTIIGITFFWETFLEMLKSSFMKFGGKQ